MSKPILWLGPLEELDVDFDPLLGTSAKQAQPNTVFTAPAAAFDPSRSVFDDPVDDVALASSMPTVSAIANEIGSLTSQSTIALVESNPETVALADPEALTVEPVDETETQTETETETETETALVIEPALQATDFTHNNDPIPVRQDGQAKALDQPPTSAPFQTDTFLEAAVPKKSFFASLFSVQAPAPVSGNNATSINDIWAKTEPESINVSEVLPQVETDVAELAPLPAEAEPSPDLLAPSNLATPAIDGPHDKTNIWADIDEEVTLQTEAQLIPTLEENDTEAAAFSDLEAPATIENSDPVKAEIAEIPAEPEETNVDSADLIVEQPDQAQTDSPDNVPDVSVSAYFQKTFNADKFWSLPRGTHPPHEVPSEQLDADEPVLTPLPVTETQEETRVANVPDKPILALDDSAAQAPNASTQHSPSIAPAATAAPRPKVAARRRKKKVKKNYIGTFLGTCLFMTALVMTVASSLAVAGYPFTMISSYRWYWVIMAVLAAATWGVTRGWKMVGASFAVIGVNLFVTVPATGIAPTGGTNATAVVGWANVAGNREALARVFKDAERKKATLLMLAETPQSVLTPPAGWTLIEAPIAGDPTAIAVLSRSTWRAVTVPGEPTMARPQASDMTIIGLHPPTANKGLRKTTGRATLINRSGTRAGIQEGPTIVLGDFDAPPWAQEMTQFRSYGNVKRVACGGWAATTLSQGFGLIGIATDHAFVRDVMVTHCQLGAPLTGGNHKPIWLYVAPQPAPPPAQPQP
jgi:hypothetical protein